MAATSSANYGVMGAVVAQAMQIGHGLPVARGGAIAQVLAEGCCGGTVEQALRAPHICRAPPDRHRLGFPVLAAQVGRQRAI